MRKDSNRVKQINIASVQGYHSGHASSYALGHESYAFAGFTGNWYFNSDRRIALDSHFNRADGQPLQGYGFEIETECKGIRNQRVLAEVLQKIVFPVFKFGADMFKMQNDCSLGGDTSAEIITQVMTKSRIRNDYAAYRAMFNDYFPAFCITADSYKTSCGMHVNVSNAVFGKTEEQQTEAIRKLYYIVNKHYSLACKLFYRSPNRTNWCGRMDYSVARELDLHHASSSHGNCMNLSHFDAGRIEIRLVGGQKDYFCFRNTMETVFFLCEKVRSLKWDDLDDYKKIFKGCNQYVFKRLATEAHDILSIDDLEDIRANVKEEDLELQR